jgi:hypothetical protein
MKEFKITITRIQYCERIITVKAENEAEARMEGMNFAADSENGDWYGTEKETKYEIVADEIPNDYIDQYGNPYDSEDEHACWPAGGGLHKDCEFNADALYAYYTLGDREKIEKYLFSKGFLRVECRENWEQWVKGNTQIDYEDYDNGGHLWGYMHTELIDTD